MDDTEEVEVRLRWPTSCMHYDEDYDELLVAIQEEEALQKQWALHYRCMNRWFAEEQARCAMPTVADVAEHWSYNDGNYD
jgi:hypothetical protein